MEKPSSVDGVSPLERAKHAHNSLIAIRRHLSALHTLRETIVGHELPTEAIDADLEIALDFVSYVEAAMSDPRNMIEFISGQGRTYKGGF